LKEALDAIGIHGLICTEELRLPGRSWDPEGKVDSFLRSSEAFVALVTPDERLANGAFRCRPNIPDEVGRARTDPRLQEHMIVVKTPEMTLWSNINPTYELLDVDNPDPAIEVVIEQLRAWGLVPEKAHPIEPAESDVRPQPSQHVASVLDGLDLGEHEEAERRVYRSFLSRPRREWTAFFEAVLDVALSTNDHRRCLVACSVLEAVDRLDPTLVSVETIETLAGAEEFSLRSSAAIILWQWSEVAPMKVPLPLLGRLARPQDEDWYVQAPAIAAAKQLMLRRPDARQIFDHLAESPDVEARYSAATALLNVAHVLPVVVPLDRVRALCQDPEESVASKGAELLRALDGIDEDDRRNHFSSFGL